MVTNVSNQKQVGKQVITKGLTREWLNDGRIVVFTLENPSRDVVENYIRANLELMHEAEDSKQELVIVMHDISDPNMSLTPLLRDRLNDIAQKIKEGNVQYRSAVVMQKSAVGFIFSLFGNMFNRKAKNTIQQFFTSREDALNWLQQFI